MSVKEKVKDAGQAVADTAKNVGHKIAEGAECATDWVKDKTGMGTSCGTDVGVAGIKERMDVIASCGKKIGVVDHMEGTSIKLTQKDSADGMHHFIPTNWVDHVDGHVHLKKNSMEAIQGWKSDAASCGCGA
jgi:hypothetical protein